MSRAPDQGPASPTVFHEVPSLAYEVANHKTKQHSRRCRQGTEETLRIERYPEALVEMVLTDNGQVNGTCEIALQANRDRSRPEKYIRAQ
ncbi:MAG: hypothetical protein MZV63_29680 [Marinilabiliales bacterium]|nr:hypothetical protein [Marinilabiliales bacterium]